MPYKLLPPRRQATFDTTLLTAQHAVVALDERESASASRNTQASADAQQGVANTHPATARTA